MDEEIFKRWEKEITGEWRKYEAYHEIFKDDKEAAFKAWVIQKLVALFTWNEMNTRRIK
tara:strand:+ start:289 stop:465 length:177 start_codon:yes stop_codon:yes gene_type:complete